MLCLSGFELQLYILDGCPRYLIRTPCHYGRFTLCLGKQSPYIYSKFNPLNTDTPLIRTLPMPPQSLY